MTKLTDDQLLAQASALDEAYASATGPAEAYDRDLLALVHAVKEFLKTQAGILRRAPGPLADMWDALEQFEPWLDNDNDPRSMGWVDDRGRP